MDKRTLVAVLLSLFILMIWQVLFAPKPQQVNVDNKTAVSEVKKKDNASEAVTKSKEPVKEIELTKKNVKKPETVSVKTEYLEIQFDKNSGDIYSAAILKYRDKNIGKVVFKDGNYDYLRFKDLNFDNVKYDIKEGKDKTIITFDCFLNSLVFTKKYEISHDNYLINFSMEIANIGDSTVKLPLTMILGPDFGEGFDNSRYIFAGPIIYDGKKVYKKRPNKIKEDIAVSKPMWIGYTTKYFLFAAVANVFEQGVISKFENSAVAKGITILTLNPNEKKKLSFHIFSGPKEYKLLKSVGYKLEKSIDFGFFAFLAIPMLNLMNFFYKFVHNYGVAIILLTILIKVITYPLTVKSMTSMKKMQLIQPEIQKIREKFKGDPQKMNTAMMELYKKYGVNPMGGCLPMVIQIPIFFALYKALLVSIELKGSPFFGWITDLSARDPYYITPILMGISMFLQQRMTPQAGDPTQRKIFMFMPVLFTFLFLNFPSGLVIYWLTNNILTIIQQYLINKKTAV